MKKLLIITAMIMATSAFAGEGTHSQSASTLGQTQSASTASTSDASNAGNSQGVTLNIEASQPKDLTSTYSQVDYGTQVIKNTPSVSGPNLTTSNDTCMGSTSGSVNIAGFGAGAGSTYVEPTCVRMKLSREQWNKGNHAVSFAMDCINPEVRFAARLTGAICPQDMTDAQLKAAYGVNAMNLDRSAKQDGTVASVDSKEPTDPYIRMRKGLPVLATK
jgi:hypothetical protein